MMIQKRDNWSRKSSRQMAAKLKRQNNVSAIDNLLGHKTNVHRKSNCSF
jgi:hypothetical protein